MLSLTYNFPNARKVKIFSPKKIGRKKSPDFSGLSVLRFIRNYFTNDFANSASAETPALL